MYIYICPTCKIEMKFVPIGEYAKIIECPKCKYSVVKSHGDFD